ncbi:MAG: haloacid dehalogenase-like hydrolase, partial [Bacteroidota bacterium]
MQEQALENKKIICVDLDGTLVLTDTLIESVILALKKNPLIILILPLWILRGKLYFKNRIGSIVIPNCESLPYNYELIDYLKTEKQNNSIIVLVTASIQSIADAVARHLMLFDFVYGSSDSVNLRAENKKNKLTEKFGFKKYIYAGDSKADIPVWFGASSAILVNPSKSIIKELKKQVLVQKTIYTPGKSIKSFIKEIRIYQWIKNILIFLPLLLAHQITNQPLLFTAFIAFLSYSFAASSIYILNDLLDLESDRNHPRKKNRP